MSVCFLLLATFTFFKEKSQAKLYNHRYKRGERLKHLIITGITLSSERVLQDPNIQQMLVENVK